MTILGLELEEWWSLIRVIIRVMLMTTVLLVGGVLIHEGAHAFVALCLGREIVFFRFTGFLGAEIGIYCAPYLVPIAFAGGFAEGLYLLVVRRYTKSQWVWMATLTCWIYALAEVWWVSPPKGNPAATLLLGITTLLVYAILFIGLAWPRFNEIFDPSDYRERKPVGGLPVWVPSERRSYG